MMVRGGVVPGDSVRLVLSGLTCTVGALIGEGGQGAVHRVELDDGHVYALKWYAPHASTVRQRSAIEELVRRPPPSDRFLWPIDVAHMPTSTSFGYVMPLRPASHVSLGDVIARRIELTFHDLARLGADLADSFLALHNQGLCYRDLSFSNVFFNPSSGHVLVCDVDNVSVDHGQPAGVLGTPFFIAPEIVRDEATPSTATDLYSLAVLLFLVLVAHHPLDGRRTMGLGALDPNWMTEAFGTAPIFLFDPVDDRNRPVAGVHDLAVSYWSLYPGFVRDLFIRSFTEGLHHPGRRVRESEWRAAMVRLDDVRWRCPACGATVFYDERAPLKPCWTCDAALPSPILLRVPSGVVVVTDDTVVTAHHLRRDYDITTIVGTISRHPSDPSIIGLTNRSHAVWRVSAPGGAASEVPPGRSVALASDLDIDFGQGRDAARS